MSDPALIRDPILEAATRALDNCIEGYQVTAVLAAVTPLLRAQVLEEAAQRIEGGEGWFSRVGVPARVNLAAAIRALRDQS